MTVCGGHDDLRAVAAFVLGALYEPPGFGAGFNAGGYIGARVVRDGDRLLMMRQRVVRADGLYPASDDEEAVASRPVEGVS